MPRAGGTPTVWADGAALAPVANGLPGPNGLKLFGDELYVTNPSQGTVVAIAVNDDGSAGATRTHASGIFCDDFAFDDAAFPFLPGPSTPRRPALLSLTVDSPGFPNP